MRIFQIFVAIALLLAIYWQIGKKKKRKKNPNRNTKEHEKISSPRKSISHKKYIPKSIPPTKKEVPTKLIYLWMQFSVQKVQVGKDIVDGQLGKFKILK